MRLFIAIDPPEQIQEYFKSIQTELDPSIKLVKSFHLTLKFLGEVDESTSNKVIETLSKVKFDPFELETTNLGAFPNENYTRVLWIGIKDQPDLMKLQKDIEDALSEFKFKKDFNFHPHITLARVHKKIKFPNIETEPESFKVNNFIIYKSTLTPSGPVYKILKTLKSF